MGPPDCFKCKHRRASQWGGSHSSCAHPKAVLLDMDRSLGVEAAAHGVRMGWFTWPADFDPIWLRACGGFEAVAAERIDPQP